MIVYDAPVSQLLTLGEVSTYRNWLNYRELGLTEADAPALLQMADDDDLNWADTDSLEVWAPVHARRALAQLKVEVAIRPLVAMIREHDEDDWLQDDAEQLLTSFGPRALPALADYLANAAADDKSPGLTNAAVAVAQIGKKYPEVRRRCIDLLVRRLQLPDEQSDGLMGFIVDGLVELKAKDALPAMSKVFLAGNIDPMIIDWPYVKSQLGLDAEAQLRDFISA